MIEYLPTVGNDPELFVKQATKLIPSESFVKSPTKTYHVDNAALELNVGPSHCLQQHAAAFSRAFNTIKTLLAKSSKKEFSISIKASEKLQAADIRKYKSVAQFGCEPSLVFRADKGLNTSYPQIDGNEILDRSIGFHVHLGCDKISEKARKNNTIYLNRDHLATSNILHSTEGRSRLVQVCDAIVGLPAVLLDRDPKEKTRRLTLGYGKAGEFREQPHGFEYRTLGPWPLTSPVWTWWANAAVRDAFLVVLNDLDKAFLKKLDMVSIAEAIDNNDLKLAKNLWVKIKEALGPILSKTPNHWSDRHPILNVKNLERFEFILTLGGLRYTNPNPYRLNVKDWLEKSHGTGSREYSSYYKGFPSVSATICLFHKEFKNFNEKWELGKDNLSSLED